MRMFALVALLSACGGAPETNPPETATEAEAMAETSAPTLDGLWRVTALGEQSFEPSERATIAFSPETGRVAGAAFCNRYAASYELSGDALSFGPAVGTKRGCAPELMALERTYLEALSTIDRIAIDGDTITLMANGAPLIRATR